MDGYLSVNLTDLCLTFALFGIRFFMLKFEERDFAREYRRLNTLTLGLLVALLSDFERFGLLDRSLNDLLRNKFM